MKLDHHPIPSQAGEIRCFVCIKNESIRLPYFLEYHRRLGVNRFFFVDNASTDGTTEYLLSQPDCHCYHTNGSYFSENIAPPSWTNALTNVFGDGHWCLTLDADELFVYPECELVALDRFCDFLHRSGSQAVFAPVIDMYGDGPLVDSKYHKGQPFFEANPFFDPQLGWIKEVHGWCPPQQMFGGVRERVFWRGRHKKNLPPCISKLPLVKWRRGMYYVISQHFLSGAKVSEIQATILHFKFLTGFYESSVSSVIENKGIAEKGLEERAAYVDVITREPALTLRSEESVCYQNSRQLIELGWLKTSPAYEDFISA